MITRMDRKIGELLNLLEEIGLNDNSIIFFASDNDDSEEYEEIYLEENPGV